MIILTYLTSPVQKKTHKLESKQMFEMSVSRKLPWRHLENKKSEVTPRARFMSCDVIGSLPAHRTLAVTGLYLAVIMSLRPVLDRVFLHREKSSSRSVGMYV